jgi:uncharacterized protein with PIN domain
MDAPPRFLVDGMLVRLGKYLRCAGYDATWQLGWPTHALVRRAADEDRVLLTRNSRLGGEIAAPPRWLELFSDDPVAQLREVGRAFCLDLARGLFTRCIRCNVELRAATPDEVLARVLAAVRERHRRFFTCPECRTVFWHGSHVANTCRKLGLEPPD